MSNIKRICFVSAALTLLVAAAPAPAAAHDGFRRPWEARPYAPRAYVYQPPIVYRPPPVYYRPWSSYEPDRYYRRPHHRPDRWRW
ncbi:MAG: hypothetical protein ACOVVK_20605 [Elsteraceae bacterium]